MQIHMFDTFDEQFSALNAASDRAMSRLSDQQRALTWGSYCLSVNPEYLLFCHIPTEAELLAMEADEDDPSEAQEIVIATGAQMEQKGHMYGQWFSIIEPDGEWGHFHKLTCWPITEAIYEAAKANGWDFPNFPQALAGELTARISMLQDHMDMELDQ